MMPSKQAYIAANRFGYGADTKTMAMMQGLPKQWLSDQLTSHRVNAELELSSQRWGSHQVLESVAAYTANKLIAKVGTKKELSKKTNQIIIQSIRSAIKSDNPFLWRVLDFFSNHFSVTGNKLVTRALAPALEIEAIGPHLSGRFSDMLMAIEAHPAMLYYLDNVNSIGPNSSQARRSKKNRGLNENLAREILELHTLGLNAGYQQHDVTELAKAITGWSVGRKKEPTGFIFRDQAHEPGRRQIMTHTYGEGGLKQGQDILFDLANHPETARHISTKLVTHFISDRPPQAIVDAMVKKWLETQGHIPEVINVMVQHPLSWSNTLAKFKTPRDLVISACRACGLKTLRPNFIRSLTILGQKPFGAGSPAGYKDIGEYWMGPSAMMSRIEWVNHISKLAKETPQVVAGRALGPFLRAQTSVQVNRAESKRQGLTLLLMSPEFQQR
jgi:uncharacterized protein (DUF1800 family)